MPPDPYFTHELHCNASRVKPIGCDMCSCELGRAFKKKSRKGPLVLIQADFADMEATMEPIYDLPELSFAAWEDP